MGSIPGSGRSPGGGPSNLLQYSCLENPMDRGAWQATVRGGHKRVGHDWSEWACMHTLVTVHPTTVKTQGLYCTCIAPSTPAEGRGCEFLLVRNCSVNRNHFLLFPSRSIHFHRTVTTLLFFRHTWQLSRSFAITPPLRGCVLLRTWVSSKSIYTFGACVQSPVGRELHEDKDFHPLLWSLCPDSEWPLANIQ